MTQLWWLQRNNRRRVGQNKQTDLVRFLGQKSRKVGQRLGNTLQIDTSILVRRYDVSFRKYVVSSAKVANNVMAKN